MSLRVKFLLAALLSFCYLCGAGDLVSPGMFEDHLTSLNTAWAYHDSGEGYVYEFAVNLETLNYLQTINLLEDDKLAITLEYMQTSK